MFSVRETVATNKELARQRAIEQCSPPVCASVCIHNRVLACVCVPVCRYAFVCVCIYHAHICICESETYRPPLVAYV